MIQFEYLTKVYYKDVDQMGIVYYSRYYEYFEAARTELLKSLGIHVTVIEKDNQDTSFLESRIQRYEKMGIYQEPE